MAAVVWVDEAAGSVAVFENGRWHPPETLHQEPALFLGLAVNGGRAAVVWKEISQPPGVVMDGTPLPSAWKAGVRTPDGWTVETIASGEWAFSQGAQIAPLGDDGFVAFLTRDNGVGYLAVHEGTSWREPITVPNIPDVYQDGGTSPIVGFANGTACGLVRGEPLRTTMWVFDGTAVETRSLPNDTFERLQTRFAGTANGCVVAFRDTGPVTLWGWRSGEWLEPDVMSFANNLYELFAVGGDDDRFVAVWAGAAGTSLWYALHDRTRWAGPTVLEAERPGPSLPRIASTAGGFIVAWTERDQEHPASRVIRQRDWSP